MPWSLCGATVRRQALIPFDWWSTLCGFSYVARVLMAAPLSRSAFTAAVAAGSAWSGLRAGSHVGGDSAAPGAEAAGERRHITVMFCDLVDSTGISARLEICTVCKRQTLVPRGDGNKVS